jgi:endonuclease-3
VTAKTAWKPPARSRIRAVRDRLRGYYGRPRNEPHQSPLDELVLTVLSQNTNDRNRDVAYVRLRERFADWGAVAAARVEDIEEAIRPGGISKVKSLRIKSMLEVIEAETGGLDLGFLAAAPREQAVEFLERLPGVGRKTAACVLMFAFDRPEIPVDTHVYRVCTRLGLLRSKASFEEAHDVMREATDTADAFELHVNLIRHGRRICTARNPACPKCPLLAVCPYGKQATGRSR